MVVPLTGLKVFIGSPGGVEEQREWAKKCLLDMNGIVWKNRYIWIPVRSEEMHGGLEGQAYIDKNIDDCDFGLFIYSDTWGEGRAKQEFNKMEENHKNAKGTRDVVVIFKKMSPGTSRNPGPEAQKVIDFKNELLQKKYTIEEYSGNETEFRKIVEKQLNGWLDDILNGGQKHIDGVLSVGSGTEENSGGAV
ncbi:MAG: hypothetical protein GX455_05465 [Phycisphaerae bacterium]|nr:hypothetical protein [Phycisphaerae bacterium]